MRKELICSDCETAFDSDELKNEKCPHCSSENWSWIPELEKADW